MLLLHSLLGCGQGSGLLPRLETKVPPALPSATGGAPRHPHGGQPAARAREICLTGANHFQFSPTKVATSRCPKYKQGLDATKVATSTSLSDFITIQCITKIESLAVVQ